MDELENRVSNGLHVSGDGHVGQPHEPIRQDCPFLHSMATLEPGNFGHLHVASGFEDGGSHTPSPHRGTVGAGAGAGAVGLVPGHELLTQL